MKKLFALTLIMIMAFTLAACGNKNRSTTNSDKTTTSDESNNQTQLDTAKKNILVAYFSYSGNTQVIANQIHESV